jgi:hypothetical protein
MRTATFLLLSIILTISCDENSVTSSDQFESKIDESQVITLSAQTYLLVESTNGDIVISISDTASNIYCDITKKVRSRISENDAQSHLSQIDITIEKNTADVKIEVDHPMNDDRDYEIVFDILLPNNFNYALNLGNGNISVNSSTKSLVINLGNGSVQTDVILLDTCFVSVSIGNGNMNLIIPGNTNAELSASVGNGNISNNGLNFQNQQITSRQYTGTLGSGVGIIVLSVGNGNITMNER